MTQQREGIQRYLDTDTFLATRLQELPDALTPQWLAGHLQNLLHWALEFFLNTPSYSFAGQCLIPRGKGQSIWKERLILLQRLVNAVSKVIGSSLEITECERHLSTAAIEQYTVKSAAKVVSLGYRVLETLVERLAPSLYMKLLPAPSLIQSEAYAKEAYLHPVVGFGEFAARRLAPYLELALLHGSLATLDYVQGFSDFDTFLIVKRDVVVEHDRLLEFRQPLYNSRQFLLALDPWQHHSHVLITAIDLAFYPQTYFPLVLFKKANSVFTSNVALFSFALRDCTFEEKVQFSRKIDRLRSIASGQRRLAGWYDWKHFLADVFLTPSFYLQLAGQYLDKPASLAICREIFKDHWGIVEKMSRVRMACSSRIGRLGYPFRLTLRLDPALGQMLCLRVKDTLPKWVAAQLGPEHMREVYALCDRMLDEAYVNGMLD
jgi:hypothetical protein